MSVMGQKNGLDLSACLDQILEQGEFMKHDQIGVRASCAWAEVEARCPERVRLFFIDDFLSNPEVAMGGLARFLDVDSTSDATLQALHESPGLADFQQLALAGPLRDWREVTAISELVDSFESFMSNAPELRPAWECHLAQWLKSPNPRLVALGTGAMQQERWNPAHWWALHSARVCRPCLFFPRGKCSDDGCPYCHSLAHHKPKRPSKSRRNRRHGRGYDRTPSPETTRHELSLENGAPSNDRGQDSTWTPFPGMTWHEPITTRHEPSLENAAHRNEFPCGQDSIWTQSPGMIWHEPSIENGPHSHNQGPVYNWTPLLVPAMIWQEPSLQNSAHMLNGLNGQIVMILQ